REYALGAAVTALRQAYANDAQNVSALINLGRVNPDRQDAEQCLLAAAASLANGVEPRSLMGPFVRVTWEAFEVELEKVWYEHRAGTPEWSQAMHLLLAWNVMEMLADMALLSHRYDEAVLRARAAVQLRPDMGSTRARLARALYLSGAWNEAADEYLRAL